MYAESVATRAAFSWVAKVIWDCDNFALFLTMVGRENSGHFLNQSNARLKRWNVFLALEALHCELLSVTVSIILAIGS